MENEENPRRALPFKNKECFYFEDCRHQACWHTYEEVNEVRNQTWKLWGGGAGGPQKGEWKTYQAIFFHGNLAPFAPDLATERPRLRFGE